jgi:hypothetical protein
MPVGKKDVTPVPGVENLTYEDVNILMNFQKLWTDLVFWLRNFFRSYLENQPDLASVTTELFQQLPMEFYNEFKKYMGPEDAAKFYDINTRLITLNWQMINAYKDNNQAAINESVTQWYKTADEFAQFLNSVNKYWDAKQIQSMLYGYIELKIKEIIAFLSGDYETETKIFNDLEKKSIDFATYLAMGIIQKRPRRMPVQPKHCIV